MRALIGDGLVTAVHDLSDGGLLVALAEMAMASGIGATLDARARRHAERTRFWFGEDQARYVVTVPRGRRRRRAASARRTPACRCAGIGTTGGDASLIAGERADRGRRAQRALRGLAAGLHGRRH